MPPIRAILDTNLWLHFLISKQYKTLDRLFAKGRLRILFSERLMEEFIEVANRPKFRKYFSVNALESLLNNFDAYGELIEVSSSLKLCRDEKDNFLLDLGVDGQADYLVTGDKDLLILGSISNMRIVSWREFEDLVNA